MYRFLIPIFFFIFPFLLDGQPTKEGKAFIIGQEYSIKSKVFGNNRPVLVSLPDDYLLSDQKYPVVYLLDGRGNFRHTTATVNFLARNGRIPQMIVVGLPNTDDRTRDLTPQRVHEDESFPTAGGADNMLEFMKDEVFPFMDKNYRTEDYKLLIGHSFGGLFAIHSLVNHPNVFNSYISISPSLWWDNQDLVQNQTTKFFEENKDLSGHLYMTMGNEDGAMLGGAWKLAALLEEKSATNFQWHFERMEEEHHGSIPMRSTYKGLEYIFEDWCLEKKTEFLAQVGMKGMLDYVEQVAKLYNMDVEWTEKSLVKIGAKAEELKNDEVALEVYTTAAEIYPESEDILFRYGHQLSKTDDKEGAISILKKVQEINPEHMSAQVLLKKLGEDVEGLATLALTLEQLKIYTGTFDIGGGREVLLSSDGEKLFAEAQILSKEELMPLDVHTFFVSSLSSKITYIEEAGKLDKIKIETPDATFFGHRIMKNE